MHICKADNKRLLTKKSMFGFFCSCKYTNLQEQYKTREVALCVRVCCEAKTSFHENKSWAEFSNNVTLHCVTISSRHLGCQVLSMPLG